MKQNIFTVALLTTAVAIAAPLDPMPAADFGSPAATDRVLIVSEASRYKERLLEALVEQLATPATYVAVRSFDDFAALNAADYDGVLVINAGVGSEVRPQVVRWLNAQGSPNNVIVLTTQISNWTPNITVDSVTTASRNRNIPEVSRDLVARVRALL